MHYLNHVRSSVRVRVASTGPRITVQRPEPFHSGHTKKKSSEANSPHARSSRNGKGVPIAWRIGATCLLRDFVFCPSNSRQKLKVNGSSGPRTEAFSNARRVFVRYAHNAAFDYAYVLPQSHGGRCCEALSSDRFLAFTYFLWIGRGRLRFTGTYLAPLTLPLKTGHRSGAPWLARVHCSLPASSPSARPRLHRQTLAAGSNCCGRFI